jgi:nicotinamidase/pyrazinamidase
MTALILVDLQNDFLPGGALAVTAGDEVLPVANKMMSAGFKHIVATQDWHPANHGSFASNNPGAKAGSMGKLSGLNQVMWPNHCVQGTRGAEFAAKIDSKKFTKVFKKGTDPSVDSYSGFFDNGGKNPTGLSPYLKSIGVLEVVVMGLATDYCVKFTALDAVTEGFKVTFLKDGSRAVNINAEDEAKAIQEMKSAGVTISSSDKYLADSGGAKL